MSPSVDSYHLDAPNDNINNQFMRLQEILSSPLNSHSEELKPVLGKIIFIKALMTRVETRRNLADSNLQSAFSFMIESFTALEHNELNATRLLLRVSVDQMVKYLLSHYHLHIDEHRFSPNVNTLQNSNAYSTLKKSYVCNPDQIIGRFCQMYDRLSKLTHNISGTPIEISGFFSSIVTPEDGDTTTVIEYLNKIATDYCDIVLEFSLFSVSNWENEDRLKLLRLAYGNNKVAVLNNKIISNR